MSTIVPDNLSMTVISAGDEEPRFDQLERRCGPRDESAGCVRIGFGQLKIALFRKRLCDPVLDPSIVPHCENRS